jgi:hypothetical protein
MAIFVPSIPLKRITPTVIRESICWKDAGDAIEVSLDVLNLESTRNDELELIIEAAPFGAFVPGKPVARIAVGAMDPGEGRNLTVRLDRSTLDQLGLSPILFDSARASGARAIVDPRRHPRWIGNLNVYFDRDPDNAIERHCAFNLRVPVATTIAAAFFVKEASPCEITTATSSSDWSAKVIGNPQAPPFNPLGSRRSNWHRIRLVSVTTPGQVGNKATVTVDVRRQRDARVVSVEFEFETVQGWGESLGCVQVGKL